MYVYLILQKLLKTIIHEFKTNFINVLNVFYPLHFKVYLRAVLLYI